MLNSWELIQGDTTMSRYVFCEGSEDDFDTLYEIYMHNKVNPFLDFEVMDKASFKPIFQNMLSQGQLYLYRQSPSSNDSKAGPIVATGIVKTHKARVSHCATITSFATHPNHCKQGIGSAFMKHILEMLKQQGIRRVDLYAEADNESGLHFFKKLGFQLEGVMRDLIRRKNEDHYVDEHLLAIILD